jgi:hypothetical protein
VVAVRIKERARTVKDSARMRTRAAMLERADAERSELRAENEQLRDRVRDAQAERGQWFSIMERIAEAMPEISNASIGRSPKHRIRRVLVLGAAAGSAYVLGAKAGRGRYEQMRAWWRGLGARDGLEEVPGITSATV